MIRLLPIFALIGFVATALSSGVNDLQTAMISAQKDAVLAGESVNAAVRKVSVAMIR